MLISTLFPFLFINICAVLLAAVADVRFSRTVPVIVMSIMAFIYPFYALDVLRAGKIALAVVLCLLSVGLAAFCVVKKNPADRVKRIATSVPFVIYCLLVLLLLVLSSNKFVYLWDSLRLWGAYPKALWTFERRQLGADAFVYPIMQSYLPGMPLLSYFMTGFSKTFHESAIYFTNNFFDFILIFPIIDRVIEKTYNAEIAKGKKTAYVAKMFLFATVAAVVLPWLVYRNYGPYVTLLIDPALGILAGYHFTACVNGFGTRKLTTASALLSGICLVLLKDSGILFACAGVVAAILLLFCTGRNNRKETVATLTCSAGVLACLSGVWYSWRLLMESFSVHNHIAYEVNVPGAGELLKFAVNIFIQNAVEIEFFVLQISLTLPVVLLLLFAAKFIMAYLDASSVKKELAEIAVMLTAAVVFLIGYYFVFRNEILRGEYPSYARYTGTLVLCALYAAEYDAVRNHLGLIARGKKRLKEAITPGSRAKKTVSAVRAFALCAVVLFTAGSLAYIYKGKAKKTDPDFTGASVFADALVKAVDTGDQPTDVFLYISGYMKGHERLHHRTYFELIDEQIRIKNFYTETNITSEGLGYTPEQFIDELINTDYEYVMFSRIDETLFDEFQNILGESSTGETNVVYRVNKENRSIERVNY